MRHWALRLLFWSDQLRFVYTRARWRRVLQIESPVSPNLRFARIRADRGSCMAIGTGFATERQPGNFIWLQEEAQLRLGPDTWLCTENGANRIRAFPRARIEVGARTLINGAMLHAKREIRIGSDCRLGFGVRILDADLHDLDRETPEQIEPVRIGNRVWIAADALVLRGVTIGDDCVVGAGSIVTQDLPAGVLALGAPARPVRELAPRTECA